MCRVSFCSGLCHYKFITDIILLSQPCHCCPAVHSQTNQIIQWHRIWRIVFSMSSKPRVRCTICKETGLNKKKHSKTCQMQLKKAGLSDSNSVFEVMAGLCNEILLDSYKKTFVLVKKTHFPSVCPKSHKWERGDLTPLMMHSNTVKLHSHWTLIPENCHQIAGEPSVWMYAGARMLENHSLVNKESSPKN